MKRIKSLLAVSLVMATGLLTACAGSVKANQEAVTTIAANESSKPAEKQKLKLACVAFNYDEVNNPAAIKKLNDMGYEVEVVVLEDATTMNEATMTGEIDASLHQHKPWMDAYNESKNRNMVMLTPYIHYNVFGMYSNKYKSISELPDGATISIPQDSSNMARALLLMEQQGLIKLKDSVKIPTTLDIVEIPKNLNINELHSHQVVRSMPDVDACATAKMFIVSNNIPLDTEICVSGDLKDFGVGFVINPSMVGEKWAKDLISAYTSDEMREEINRIFKGCYVPGF